MDDDLDPRDFRGRENLALRARRGWRCCEPVRLSLDGPLSVSIGGPENTTELSPVFFSSLGIYDRDVEVDEIVAFSAAGPRTAVLEPRFFVNFAGQNGATVLNSRGNWTPVFLQTGQCNTQTFSDALLSINKAVVFPTLFSMLDITAKDESQVAEMFCLAFDLLSIAIQLGRHIELSFEESNGFQILGSLLLNSKSFILTYPIYAIFGSLTVPSLQKAFLENLDLVSTAPVRTQCRIVKHWANTIRMTYAQLFDSVLSIRTILCAIHQYYAHDNAPEVRRKLLELVLEQAPDGIATEDLKLLVSASVNAPPDLCKELLAFIRRILMIAGQRLQQQSANGLFWTALTSLLPKANANAQMFIQWSRCCSSCTHFN
jgi:hypothetical protein